MAYHDIARTFATASRATVAGSRRFAMMATAGVASASVLSYAYLQSMSKERKEKKKRVQSNSINIIIHFRARLR